MKERIQVKNFGPIKDIDIEIKEVNIFIGKTSSGKSTVAKLLAIFQSNSMHYMANWNKQPDEEPNNSLKEFRKMLNFYNIDFKVSKDTIIRYERGELYCQLRGNTFETTFSPYSTIPVINPVYIPAERSFFAALSQSIFSLITNDIALPKSLTELGSKFEIARRDTRELLIDFLDVTYKFEDGNDVVEMSNGETIKLTQASSGVQSTVPLMLVLQAYTEDINNVEKEIGNDLFVVEEPEINLYPSAQKALLEYIIRRIARSKDKVVITTHSPYILTSLDNLVQADNVAKYSNSLDKLSEIVPRDLWTDFDQVTCSFFENGLAKSTLDQELRSLGPSNIDGVSEELGETFDHLLNMRYKDK
jgi:AAA15 family ATPase/GTPase